MTRLRLCVATLVAAFVALEASPLRAADPEALGFSTERLERIHEMVKRRVDAGEISGAVTLVARRGEVVQSDAAGVMDLDSQEPMAKDTLFRLASTTKPVTAAAVLILLEEGRLKLTDPVSKYIPEFANPRVFVEVERHPEPMVDRPASAPETYTIPADREITIIDLLTHTSGLASGGPGSKELVELLKERKPTDTLADFIPRLGALPLDFQPGTRWSYSGLAGFDTLGRIVEIASGLTFDRFLRERLFAPLGMNDTFFNVPEKDRPRLATIYHHTEKGLVKPERPLVIGSPAYFSGAGGLVTTVGDFFRFAQMLCNGGELDGVRILSPWTVDLMTTNNVGDLFLGQIGRPPRGVGFGLGGEVILDAAAARMRKPDGSYGWDGAFGTYWWVNRREEMVAIIFVQTPGRAQQYDFDNAVSQAVIGPPTAPSR
jgi:CubicO group peptidase (beta-lactamase class C family)